MRSLKTSLVKAGPLSVIRSSGTPKILTWLKSERDNSLTFVVFIACRVQYLLKQSTTTANMPTFEIILWKIFDIIDH